MQKAMSYNNAANNVKGNTYRFNFWYMSKDDAINILNGSNLVDKRGVLYLFLLYIKMTGCADLTYYKKEPRRDTK